MIQATMIRSVSLRSSIGVRPRAAQAGEMRDGRLSYDAESGSPERGHPNGSMPLAVALREPLRLSDANYASSASVRSAGGPRVAVADGMLGAHETAAVGAPANHWAQPKGRAPIGSEDAVKCIEAREQEAG